jgi:hypothetical protein
MRHIPPPSRRYAYARTECGQKILPSSEAEPTAYRWFEAELR